MSTFPLFIKIPVLLDSGPLKGPYFNLMTLSSNKVTSEVLWVRTPACLFLCWVQGTVIQPLTVCVHVGTTMALTVQMPRAASSGGEVGEGAAGSLRRRARVELRMLPCAHAVCPVPVLSSSFFPGTSGV